MALTQSTLQTHIDALSSAIANGERVVRHGEKTIEYRSIAELLDARNDLRRQLAEVVSASGGAVKPRQTRLYQSGRGL